MAHDLAPGQFCTPSSQGLGKKEKKILSVDCQNVIDVSCKEFGSEPQSLHYIERRRKEKLYANYCEEADLNGIILMINLRFQ